MNTLINGQETDSLLSSDRGLHYGDGLFETIAIVNGKPALWQQHLQRLFDGCQRLQIIKPDADVLLHECELLCESTDRAVAKLIITRGSGGRGYRKPEQATPSRIWSLHPWPDYPAINIELGITARICQTRLGINPLLAGIKHLNRLEQVLARSEWKDSNIAEGLMLDINGRVIEGTMSNVFFIKQGILLTPDLHEAGINGLMRQQVLNIAKKLEIDIHIQDLTADIIEAADEVFFCNSLFGLWPVRQWSHTSQEKTDWPVTRQIISCMKQQNILLD